MAENLQPTRAKWVMFHPLPQGRKKTRVWHVTTLPYDKGDSCQDLGEIRWHAPWRKYAFFPDPSTLYEPDCLEDLASFCRGMTKNHYAALKAAKLAKAPPEVRVFLPVGHKAVCRLDEQQCTEEHCNHRRRGGKAGDCPNLVMP